MAMEKKKKKKKSVSFGIQKQTPQKKKSKTKKKKKQFLKKVIDYLTSDSYMYAPLITSSPPSTSGSLLSSNIITSLTKGPFGYLKRIIAVISTRKTTTANQQTNENLANGLGEDHSLKVCSPETDFMDPEGLERAEMVKHIVHRTSLLCASSYSIDNIDHCSTTSLTVNDFISPKMARSSNALCSG